MSKRKEDQGWPPYSTWLAPDENGVRRRRLQYRMADGSKISIRSVLPREPREGYLTRPEAWAAYEKLKAAIEEKRDYGVTVKGFWDVWSDQHTSPWRKGVIGGGKRSEGTLHTLRRRTARFADMFADVPMAAITRTDHVQRYLNLGSKPDEQPVGRTSLGALAQMWRDAATEKGGQLVDVNPFADVAQQVAVEDSERRDAEGISAPDDSQCAALLTAALSDPRTLAFGYWLEFGMETGMRTGEIDAARFDRMVEVDGVMMLDVIEQWHSRLSVFKLPKWSRTGRRIVLSPRALEIVEIVRPIAVQYGSPFLFNTKDGEHMSNGWRDPYWQELREHVGGMQMKNATRHCFATRQLRAHNKAMREGRPAVPIALIAEHMGQRDSKTLQKHYAKVYDQDMQMAMAQAFAAQARPAIDELAARRRGA